MGQRLPFTVIGGFLGAGKTTLLNHWLRHAAGQRLAVLVNDFGALNIDAGLIKDHSGDTIALTNGCVCCQIGDDMSMALIGVLQQRDRFDAVVVEASGVSDPWRIAQLGLADPALALDGVIVVVDAAALPGQAADPLLADTLQRQVARADLVIVNKTDLAETRTLERVHGWIASHAPAAQRCDVHEARVPVELLSGAALLRGVREVSWVSALRAPCMACSSRPGPASRPGCCPRRPCRRGCRPCRLACCGSRAWCRPGRASGASFSLPGAAAGCVPHQRPPAAAAGARHRGHRPGRAVAGGRAAGAGGRRCGRQGCGPSRMKSWAACCSHSRRLCSGG